MANAFTPGPWSRSWISGALRYINRNVDYDCFWMPDDGEGEEANIPNYYGTRDVDLICAAPDLLIAVKQLLIHGSFDPNSEDAFEAVRLANAAIARVTGNPVT